MAAAHHPTVEISKHGDALSEFAIVVHPAYRSTIRNLAISEDITPSQLVTRFFLEGLRQQLIKPELAAEDPLLPYEL